MRNDTRRALRLGGIACFLAAAALVGCAGSEDEKDAPLVVNEVMASNQTAASDTSGEYNDFIELYNPTDQIVRLENYTISDHADEPYRFSLPASLELSGKSVLLLWADDDVEQGPEHLPFKLKRAGEGVFLSGPSGKLLDSVTFSEAPSDQSYARVPDGTGAFVWCGEPTPNGLNGEDCGP